MDPDFDDNWNIASLNNPSPTPPESDDEEKL
jgi:hypothetical protein